jgi:FAD/FMN-containing dehydrogenase
VASPAVAAGAAGEAAAPGKPLRAGLAEIVGAELAFDGADPVYSRDATETRGIEGHADAVVFPHSTEQVARVLAWC